MAETYSMSNSFLGLDYQLQVDPTSVSSGLLQLYMSTSPGHAWTLNATSEASRTKICTAFESIPYCLDIENNNSSDRTVPHLAVPGNVLGQQWTMPYIYEYQRFSNDYTGSDWYLDTYSNTYQAFMSQGNYTGQYWILLPSSSTTTVSSPSPTVSTQDMASMASTVSSPSPTANTQSMASASSASTTLTANAAAATSAGGLGGTAKIAMAWALGLVFPLWL